MRNFQAFAVLLDRRHEPDPANSGKLYQHWPCISAPEQVMNKLSLLKILVAAALIGVAAENAWSEEATPGVPATAAGQTATPETPAAPAGQTAAPETPAAPAGQTAAPGTGYVPVWYPPGPDQRGYAQPWSQPSQWPAPQPGYGQLPPYSPPYGQYRTGPGAQAVENALSARLKQTQEQLAAKMTELDTTKAQVAAKTSELETAREQLARLQTELQNATAALRKAQSDTINAGQQFDTTKAQVDTLRNILCELAARIEIRETALQNALQTTAAEPGDTDGAAAGKVGTATAEQAEPQFDPQCSQTTLPAITSGQRAKTIITPAR